MSLPGSTAIASDLEGKQQPEEFFRTDHLKTDIKGRTVRGGALTAGSNLVKQILTVGTGIVLARILGPENIGLVALVTIVTNFIDLFNDLGLSAAVVQRSKINQQQVSTLFWINVGMGVLLALITVALAPAITWFYGDARLIGIANASAIGFILGSLTIQHRALLTRQMRYDLLAKIRITTGIVSAVVGVGTALAGFGYWALVFKGLIADLFEIAVLWLLCRWRPGRPVRNSGVRTMLAFGGNLTGFRLIHYLARNLDNFLIGRFFGVVQLALYSKAYGLLLLPLQRISQPFADVMIPALSRLTDEPERYRRVYTRAVGGLCLFTIPLVAFMIGTADWLILVALGSEWSQASTMFAWLGIAGLFEPFGYTTGWLFVSQARTREQFQWGILNTALIVGAILVGLPWGPVGVAAAYGITGPLIRTPIAFWFIGRTGPLRTRDLYAGILPFLLAASAVLVTLFTFRHYGPAMLPLPGLIISAILTAIVSLLMIVILPVGRQALSDLRNMPELLMKRKHPTATT